MRFNLTKKGNRLKVKKVLTKKVTRTFNFYSNDLFEVYKTTPDIKSYMPRGKT